MPTSSPLSPSSPTPMAQRGYLGPGSSSGRLIVATDSSKDLEAFFKKQKSSETKLASSSFFWPASLLASIEKKKKDK